MEIFNIYFLMWAAEQLGHDIWWVLQEIAAGSYLIYELFWQWAYGM